MIKIAKNRTEVKSLVSDEEIEMLANIYLKLQTNPGYKKLSKEFKDYVNEYLAEELKSLEEK